MLRGLPHHGDRVSASTPASTPLDEDLYDQPGHLVRRAQQIAVSMFHERVSPLVTPIQYAVLRALHFSPGLDQVTLARRVALDTSTTAELCARLEAKGWIVRELLPRRQRRLLITAEGERILLDLLPRVHQMRDTLLSPLEPDEREEFMRLLVKFVQVNNEQSRAPLRRSDADDAAIRPQVASPRTDVLDGQNIAA
jgi:DNA-binding MarR family transcriptional regulator